MIQAVTENQQQTTARRKANKLACGNQFNKEVMTVSSTSSKLNKKRQVMCTYLKTRHSKEANDATLL